MIIAGSKQLTARSEGGAFQICFTGLARVGSQNTRDWIADILTKTPQPTNIDLVASDIATRGTLAIKQAPLNLRALTVVIAIAEPGRKLRLALISNIDRLGMNRRDPPLDYLEVAGLTPSRPELLVLGYDSGVSRDHRKFLKNMVRAEADSKSVMEALCAINVRAARNPKSRDFISEGCMASTLPTGPTPRKESEIPLVPRFRIPYLLAIDGVQVPDWYCSFDVIVDGDLHTLLVRKSSKAVRSVHCRSPLSVLGPTEELAMTAPTKEITLTARENEGVITGTIEAWFLLRDFPEGSHSENKQTAKIGRNEKCPCGSGKKYKK
jgi:SEC-C motif